MKYLTLLIVFATIILKAESQTLSGTVFLYQPYEKRDKPHSKIANAKIVSPFNAVSTSSEQDGSYEIVFGQLNVKVKIQVTKTGLEVINRTDLINIDLQETSKLNIYMDNPGAIKNRDEAMKNKIQKEINKKYENYSDQLNKKDNAANKLKEILEKEYKQTFSDIDHLIEFLVNQQEQDNEKAGEFAEILLRTNLDYSNEKYNKMLRLISEGKIDSVLILHDLKASHENISRNNNQKKVASQNNQREIEENFAFIVAATIKGDFERVDSAYILVIEADTSNFENLTRYVDYLIGQNRLTDASEFIKKLMTLTDSDQKQAFLSTFLISIYAAQNKMAMADSLIKKIMDQPDRYLNYMTTRQLLVSMINIANYYTIKEDYAKEEVVFRLTDTLFRSFITGADADITELYAVFLKSHALTKLNNYDVEGVDTILSDALKLLERNYNIDSNNTIKAEMTECLIELGRYANFSGNAALLNDCYKKVDKNCHELVEYNKAAYGPLLFNYLKDIASIYFIDKRFSIAGGKYVELVALARDLVQIDSARFKLKLSEALTSYANFFATVEKPREAMPAYKEALEIAYTSEESASEVAHVLSNMVNVGAFPPKAGIDTMRKVINIFRNLTVKNFKKYGTPLSESLSVISRQYLQENEIDQAELYAQESYYFGKALYEKDNSLYFQTYLNSINAVLLIYSSLQDTKNIKKYAEEKLILFMEINEFQANRYLDEIFMTAGILGESYNKLNLYDSTILVGEAILKLKDIEIRSAFDKKTMNLMIAGLYGLMSESFCYLKKYKEAEQTARECYLIDTTQKILQIPLGIALLFNEKYNEAKKILSELKALGTCEYCDEKTYAAEITNQIEDFQKANAVPFKLKNNFDSIAKLMKE